MVQRDREGEAETFIMLASKIKRDIPLQVKLDENKNLHGPRL
jgi:hypothetical protein